MVRCRIHLCWMPRTFHFRHFTRTCSCSSQPFTCTYFLGSTLRFLHLYWCFGCKCFTCIFAPVTTVQHFSLPLARNDEVSFLFKLVFGLGVAVAQRTFFLQHLTLAFAHMQNSDLVTYVLSFFNASTSFMKPMEKIDTKRKKGWMETIVSRKKTWNKNSGLKPQNKAATKKANLRTKG